MKNIRDNAEHRPWITQWVERGFIGVVAALATVMAKDQIQTNDIQRIDNAIHLHQIETAQKNTEIKSDIMYEINMLRNEINYMRQDLYIPRAKALEKHIPTPKNKED